MKNRIAAILVSVVIALPALPALAHEGRHHALGIVKEVTAARLVVADQHGRETAFALTPGTKYFRDRKAVGREQVTVGDRVVVKGKDVSGQMEAATVDLGAVPTPAR